MRAAISITKEFELNEDMDLEELRRRCEDLNPGDNPDEHIDWYDIIECREIWSYSIIS